jgi:hypothetical protein
MSANTVGSLSGWQPKLRQSITRFLEADTSRKQAGIKGVITKLITQRAVEVGVTATRGEVLQVLEEFENLPDWLKERFNPRSFYKEKDRVFGWWDATEQVQAEELPLYHSVDRYYVSFYGSQNEAWIWNRRGFHLAQELPLKHGTESSWVDFPVEWTEFWLPYGYALPCKLQWYWDDDEYRVSRSIIDHGFWQGWKWWEGAKYWYFNHRPELFIDMVEWWGEEPETPGTLTPALPESHHSAVLSPSTSLKRIEGVIKYLG